jgi:hypothetical protein
MSGSLESRETLYRGEQPLSMVAVGVWSLGGGLGKDLPAAKEPRLVILGREGHRKCRSPAMDLLGRPRALPAAVLAGYTCAPFEVTAMSRLAESTRLCCRAFRSAKNFCLMAWTPPHCRRPLSRRPSFPS